MANYHVLSEPSELPAHLSKDLSRLSLLYFRAEWAEPCTKAGDGMDTLVKELSTKWPKVLFLEIEAENLPDVAESFDVDSVPHCILLRGHSLLARITGTQLSQLTDALTLHSNRDIRPPLSQSDKKPESPEAIAPASAHAINGNGYVPPENETQEQLEKRSKELMTQSDVVLFMKGTPEEPRCGFSQKIVGILKEEKVEFKTFDILKDEGVRSALKTINNWPTFPQLIIKGEFVGGLDVVKEMRENGELKELLV
ncbi:thioredoxin [Atractiella rhizophila]|nr:thioredoxin [Atractiella rhizophila]